jgi:branched-chain amino acid transport system permease protein
LSAAVARSSSRWIVALVAAGIVLLALPFFRLPAFYESFLYLVFHWIVLATSWNILSGYSGYISFGHGAFFGLGIYTTAVLATRFQWPFLATLPVAGAVAATVAVALGSVVFRVKRVRGELFALLTLAVTFVLATIILNTPIDGGPGVSLGGVSVPAIGPTAASSFYFLELAAATATLGIAYAVWRSKLGAGLFAIHDDEDVAEVLGVPTFRCKLVAFALSSALAGLVGGIQALFISYVTAAETFSIMVPLTVVLMSVLGGTRHWAGPAIGATIITVISYTSAAGNYPLAGKAAVGAILIVVILFMPEGVLGTLLGRRVRRTIVPADIGAKSAADVAADRAAARPAIGGPLLTLHGVSRSFSGIQALRQVGLTIRAGEIVGLLGPNGSGKSTLINVVSGHYPADSGSVDFDRHELTNLQPHRIARLGLARTYQIPRPFAHLTVLENVVLTAMFGGAALDRRRALQEAWRWLEFTGLADRAEALPEDINLHQRKFLEFARALAARPKLLLLDEVLSGLTPTEIDSAVDLIRRIRAHGTTIVLVEHVMRAVMALADRIIVLDQGQVIADGRPLEVMAQAAVVNAYLGASSDAAA